MGTATQADLFLAILALDAYNRGYNQGMKFTGDSDFAGTQIGDAKIIDSAAKPSNSFYAVAYNWPGGNVQTVISYRGTTFPGLPDWHDVWDGWRLSLGYAHASQPQEALAFYSQVQSDTGAQAIQLTGHSLGGGLAAFVSDLTGSPADAFNNIPFGIGVAAYTVSSGSFEGANIPTNSATVRQFITEGEVATSLTARSAFVFFSLLGSGIGDGEAAALALNGLSLDNSVGSSQTLRPYAGPAASATDLHSQSLMVMLLYANINQKTDWSSIGPQLYAALYNDDLAKAVSFEKTNDGWYTPSAKMMAAIAYSALTSGYMPFGDTAVQSLFNDADTLGAAQKAGQFTDFLSSYAPYYSNQTTYSVTPVGALTEIAVQFAADQAEAAQQAGTGNPSDIDQSFAQGAFVSNGSSLKVDLNPTDWTTTFQHADKPSGTTAIFGLGDFFNAVLSNVTASLNFSDPTYSWITSNAAGFSAPLLKQLNEITQADLALTGGDLSAGGTLPEANDGTPGGALLIGGNGKGTIVGSTKGNDIIVGGQTIIAGDGNDIILAGGGAENITVGSGKNLILANSAGMSVALTYVGALGAPYPGASASGGSGQGPAPSTHKGDDLVVGNSAGGDTFTFNGADQAAFTVVWGGSGNDIFDFKTTSPSAYANVLLLTMNGVTASNITALDISKLQSDVDKTYASSGDVPTIVVLNATASDTIKLNDVTLSSPGVTITTHTVSWPLSLTNGYAFNYQPDDNASNAYNGAMTLTWYDGVRVIDNAYGNQLGYTDVINQLAANGLNFNYAPSSSYGAPGPILGVTTPTATGGLNLVNFASGDFGVSLDAGIGASAGTSNFFGADYSVGNWGTLTEFPSFPGMFIGSNPEGLQQIDTFTTPPESLGYLIDPAGLSPSAPALNINDYLLPSGGGNGGNGNGGGGNGGGDNSGGETGGGGLPIVSATAFIQDQANLDSQHQAFLVYDTAQNASAVFDALNDDANIVAITLTDSGTPTLHLTASQAINDTTALNAITNTDFTIDISDTAANVSTNLDALNLDSDVTSITLTDSGIPVLQLSASQVTDDAAALGKITNSYVIDITDTAANVSADLDALNANTEAASISLTDGGDPTLSLSVSQALADTNALDKITNSNFSIAIVDTASDVSSSFGSIAADGFISSIRLTGSGTPALDLSVNQTLNSASTLARITNAEYAIHVVDSVSNVLSAAAALDADNIISGITIVDSVANVTANAVSLAADSKIETITVQDTASNIAANADALAAISKVGSIEIVDTVANVLAGSASSEDAIHIADTAANVSANIDALNADAGISSINLTDGGTPALTLTVGQALGDTTALEKISNSRYVIDISDSAANVAAHIEGLASDPLLGTIALTDAGTPTLNVTVAQFVNDAAVLADISNSNLAVNVSDTAASVAANIDTLNRDPKIASIDLTDSGTPTLSLDVEQALGNATALSKIVNPTYSVALSDTAADVSLSFDALNGDVRISSITLTGSGSPALVLSAAQVLYDTVALSEITNTGYHIDVVDSAANILSNNATLAANPRITSEIIVDAAAIVLAQAVAIAADAKVSSVLVSDTAADVSANIDALNADSEVRAVALTDSGVPTLTLSVAQALRDGRVIGEIANKNVKIAISDTAANVVANIDVLNAESAIASITLTDSGEPTLYLSAEQTVADSQLLSKITSQNYVVAISDDAANLVKDAAALAADSHIVSVAVTDTAANISRNFDALGAIGSLSSILLTDSGVPSLTLSASQALNDTVELGEIQGAYSIVVSDDVANVLADEAGLSDDSNVNGVSVTDTAANILSNSAALAADSKVVSVTVADIASDVLANESSLAADSQIGFVEVVDTAANIVANGAALNADWNLRSIEVVDTAADIAINIVALSQVTNGRWIAMKIAGTPSLTLSAAEAVAASNFSGNFTVEVVDTAANIAANIDQLSGMSSIGSITATDSGIATLTLTVSQVLYDGAALGLVGNANSRIVVNDMAANVSPNFDALNADSAIASISLNDTGTPMLTLTVAQALADTSALGKIANADYSIAISDTAANVVANAAELEADSKVVSISIVDTAANIVSDQGALAANPLVSAVIVVDTAANVVAKGAELDSNSLVAAINISDVAASISANIDALNELARLASITITDYAPLMLSVAQTLNDTNAFTAIQAGTGFYSINVSDTAANILSNLSALTSNWHVSSVGIVDTAANVLNNLSALEAASYQGTITVEDTTANILADLSLFNESPFTIHYSSTSPAMRITSAAEGSNVATQTIGGTVFARGSAVVVGQTVTLTDNGATLATATVQADGSFTTTVTLPNEGANSIVANVTDSLGNAGSSAAIVDTLDDIAPTVAITSAAEASNIAVQTVSGTVGSGGAASVVGQIVTLTDNGAVLGTATVQADGSFTANVTLENQGANAIVASVTDSYGNAGSSAAIVDTLANVTPSVNFGSAQSSSAVFGFSGADWTVTVGGNTETLHGIERVQFADKTFELVDQFGSGTGGYQSVQSAVDQALGGETILIAPGTYIESTVPSPYSSAAGGFFINKPNLTFQGVKADGSLITTAADAQSFGATIVSGAETDFGSNLFIGPDATGTVLQGLYLAAGANTTNKLLEFWANDVTIENNFIDTFVNGTDTGAAAIYINVSGTPITQYLITGNILNEGIYVANGVGTAGQGISTTQVISNNVFDGSFDNVSGNGRYDMVAVQGRIPGIGWQPEPAQVPTIDGNTRADNAAPFIFRMTEADPSLFPSASQVATILSQNTDAARSYAYVLNSDGSLHLVNRDIGAGPFKTLYVANGIDALNLGLTAPNALYGSYRDTIDTGDTIVVQSVGHTANDITVDNLTVQATASSTDLNLDLSSGVRSITLVDYASGLGANVNVTANDLGDTIAGNSGNNRLTGGLGNDILVAGTGNDMLTGGGGYDVYKVGPVFGQTVINNAATDGTTNPQGEVDFGSRVADEDLWFARNGNDLQVNVLGTFDQLTIAGWYSSSRAQVESFNTADGLKLDSQISQLVSAMATYSSANTGFNPVTATQMPNDGALQGAIGSAWHS